MKHATAHALDWTHVSVAATLPQLCPADDLAAHHAAVMLQGKRSVLITLVTVCGKVPQSATGQPLTAQDFQGGMFAGEGSVDDTWDRCSFGLVSVNKPLSEVMSVDVGCSEGPMG